MVETGYGQKIWFNKVMKNLPECWEFDNIEQSLVKGWQRIIKPGEKLYLAGSLDSVEKSEHLQYLKQAAIKAE